MSEIIIPTDPAILARPLAEELFISGVSESTDFNDQQNTALVKAEQMAEAIGMLETRYIVNAGRCFLLPASFEADEPLYHTQFSELFFSGDLVTYSTVSMDNLLGRRAIKAFCLMFINVHTLLDGKMEDDQCLHVPVFAVESMDKVAA